LASLESAISDGEYFSCERASGLVSVTPPMLVVNLSVVLPMSTECCAITERILVGSAQGLGRVTTRQHNQKLFAAVPANTVARAHYMRDAQPLSARHHQPDGREFRSRRTRVPMAVLTLDLDPFKRINLAICANHAH